MKRIFASLTLMFGRAPRRPAPEDMTPACREVYAQKRAPEAVKQRRAAIKAEQDIPRSWRWRWKRWLSICLVNLLFVLSFTADIQVVEGALTASRLVGFHMADLNSALQVMLAYKEIVLNLVIGTGTVLFVWWLLGGRAFCSWVCPYHLLSEWAEYLHLWLARQGLVKDHTFHRGTRTVLWAAFALLALGTGYTVFEFISPVGILSRAFTYGFTLAVLWVVFLLLVEVLYSRRLWCRYLCPIGMTYGVVGSVSPVQVRYDLTKCLHEGKCRKVCLVPHVLEMTKMNHADDVVSFTGADCTRCGMCVEVCPTGALNFNVRGLDKLL